MNNDIDEELKSLALLALKNAFYRDFSGLVHSYLDAAEGLDTELLMMQLQSAANVFSASWAGAYTKDDSPRMYVRAADSRDWFAETLIGALREPDSCDISINGEVIFFRDEDGGWRFGTPQEKSE
jgi:hypothetical protein